MEAPLQHPVIPANLVSPYSVFVTSDGQIFVDNNKLSKQSNRQVDTRRNTTLLTQCLSVLDALVFSLTSTTISTVLKTTNIKCWGNLWTILASAPAIVAGTGCQGSASNMLNRPNGIFVTESLDLYVADWGNNRIQLFRSGELNGATVVSSGTTGTISLWGPTDVVLDADGYLFIADCQNNRIVGSGPYGFRCLVGCSGGAASSTQLNNPTTLIFDTDGNIFVMDQHNDRIQRFFLVNNACGE